MKKYSNIEITGSLLITGSLVVGGVAEMTASNAVSSSFATTAVSLNSLPQFITMAPAADITNISSNSDLIFSTVVNSNGLSLVGGLVTLQAGKIYELQADFFILAAAAGKLEASFYDNTNIELHASARSRTINPAESSTQSSLASCRLIFAPSVNTQVKLRCFFADGLPTIGGAPARFTIKELR